MARKSTKKTSSTKEKKAEVKTEEVDSISFGPTVKAVKERKPKKEEPKEEPKVEEPVKTEETKPDLDQQIADQADMSIDLQDLVNNLSNAIEKTPHVDLQSAGGRNRTNYLYYEDLYNPKNGDLLAVGVIDSEGRYFYGEVNDIKFAELTNELFQNVLSKFTHPQAKLGDDLKWQISGSKDEIVENLIDWINNINNENPRKFVLVSDITSFTFSHFINLLGGQEKPECISSVSIDINQDFANILMIEKTDEMNDDDWQIQAIPVVVAANTDKYEWASTLYTYKSVGVDSGAIRAANVYRAIHQFIYKL
jgi:hypothetical protein